ncbi:MAG: ketoacyl-ACP synthase III [Clostridiaceae bacterium]|nr:ketoacyl-ACP synthase III [Clostridiaceae bacterium]
MKKSAKGVAHVLRGGTDTLDFPDIRPLNIDRYAKIISTGTGIPEKIVTNTDLIEKYNIMATDRAVQYSLGIKERRWVRPDQKHDELMAEAVSECLERAGVGIKSVDRVICSRLLSDYHIPSAAVGVLRRLGAKVGTPGFDICAACSGFIHAMDLAVRHIATGDDYVLIIGGGITSKGIQNMEEINPKTVFLFGDAFAAMLIGHSDTKHFLASYIFTNPYLYDNAYIPCGTSLLNSSSAKLNFDIFNMTIEDGNLIQKSSVEYAKVISEKLLKAVELSIEDIDFFVTSDQSTKIWEEQLKAIGIPHEKSLSLFHKYGNTVSAMSPLNFDGLVREGRIKRGKIVMMMSHGAGASSGGMIFRY